MLPEVILAIVFTKACIAVYVFTLEKEWSDKILWPMVIFFIPVLGLFLYLFAHVPKRKQVSSIKID